MSMINDALRRASSAAKSGSVAPPLSTGFAPPPPLPGAAPAFPPPPPFGDLDRELPEPPSTAESSRKKKSALPLILVLFLVFGTAGGAGYFFWQQQKPVIQVQSQLRPAVAKPTDQTVGATLPAAGKAPGKAAAPVTRTNAILASVAPPATRPMVAVPAPVAPVPPAPALAPAVPVRFPPLRLQSIFYRPESPSVIINGKTLFIDDQINGVLVTDIRSSSVTLVLSGQTNILTLR